MLCYAILCVSLCLSQSLFGKMMNTETELHQSADAFLEKYLVDNSIYDTKQQQRQAAAAASATASTAALPVSSRSPQRADASATSSRDQQEGDVETGGGSAFLAAGAAAAAGAGAMVVSGGGSAHGGSQHGSSPSRKSWFGGRQEEVVDDGLEVQESAGWFKQCRWVLHVCVCVSVGWRVARLWCGMAACAHACSSIVLFVGGSGCRPCQRCLLSFDRLSIALSPQSSACLPPSLLSQPPSLPLPCLRVLLWRELKSVTRNPADVAGRCLIFTWLAIFLGLIFYNLPPTVDALRARMNVLFVEPVILLLLPYVYMSLFTSDKQYFIQGGCARESLGSWVGWDRGFRLGLGLG